MKIYKIEIKFVPICIYPFYFFFLFIEGIKLFLKKLKLRMEFKKLNWSDADVWGMTNYCGSLNDAIDTLCWNLTKDRKLYPLAKKLINAGFDRNWK